METFSYQEWLEQVPESIKSDPLWNFHVYPKTMLLADQAWEDAGRMMKDARGQAIAGQLIRSVGSICANLEKGHGRGFGKENAYFQRIALGSARESRGWVLPGSLPSCPKYPSTESSCSTKSSLPLSSRPNNNVNTTNVDPASRILHLASCLLTEERLTCH